MWPIAAEPEAIQNEKGKKEAKAVSVLYRPEAMSVPGTPWPEVQAKAAISRFGNWGRSE